MDKWCWRHGAGLLLASVLLVASSMAVAESADSPVVAESAIPNPFEGWEAWQLGGGVKLWFKQLAGAETVRVSATLPVGAQNDPEGLEGLAHFVEHVMFTDDRGRTEEEIKKEVKERGGSANGFTRLAATHYFADLPRAEWRFGLRWIHDRVFHGPIAESVVDEERKAVLLEGSLKPKEALRSLLEVVFKPEWREMPGLWEREFGLERDDDPVLGTWESVQAIRLEDLQDFYDTWYGPQNMTFVVIGDLDAKEVRAWGAELFAGLEPRGQTAVVRQAAEDPGRFRRIVDYEEDSGTTEYGVLYKVYDMTEGDYIKLLFLRQLLYEELTEKLRVRRKTTYGIDSDVRNYAGHGYLEISGKFAPEEVEYAREAIDESFESLRQGSLPPERFVELKERVISTFSLHWQDPASLDAWTPGLIANGISFAGFPNVVGAMRSYSQPEIASWVRENFTEEHRVETIERALPVSLGFYLVLVIPCLLGFVLLLRRLWSDDVDLTRLRYVRKFKYPVSYIVFLGGGLLCLVVFGIQALLFLWDWVDFLWLHGVDSFAFAIAIETFWDFSVILLVAMVLSRIPVKLLLFEHEWRVKYLFCRSKGRPYADIQELREAGFFETLFSGRALGTGFLYWGAFSKAIYLRFGPRRALFFDTRDNQEMIEQLERFAEQQRVTGSAARSRMPEERSHGLLPASGLATTLSRGLIKS